MNYELAEKMINKLEGDEIKKILNDIQYTDEDIVNVLSDVSIMVKEGCEVRLTISNRPTDFFTAMTVDKKGKINKNIKSAVILSKSFDNEPAKIFVSSLVENTFVCKTEPDIKDDKIVFIQTIISDENVAYQLVFYSKNCEKCVTMQIL